MPRASARFDQVPTYLFTEIALLKREALAAGASIIDLSIGDPDLPTPPRIVDALREAVHDPRTHRYDESPRGYPPFLTAAAGYYEREFGVALDPSRHFVQVIGSKEGLAHLAWAYADPGDVVIVPNPGYTVYGVSSRMAGAQVYETPLTVENAYLPLLEDIPTDIASRAKLFYVCYPHNPTGAVATTRFYSDLIAFCKCHDILAVCDLAYASVTFDGFSNPTILQQDGGKEVGIEFHSLSKSFNMTGWRLGFACGNEDAVAALQRLKNYIDSKQFAAIAAAGAVALQGVSNERTLTTYETRRDRIVKGLRGLGWEVSNPVASFFIWIKVPHEGMSSMEFAKRLLTECEIVVVPGEGFGSCGKGYVRMSLTLDGDKEGELFEEVIRRIQGSSLA